MTKSENWTIDQLVWLVDGKPSRPDYDYLYDMDGIVWEALPLAANTSRLTI